MTRRYEKPIRMGWAEAMKAIESEDSAAGARAMVSLAYFWKSREQLEQLYVELLGHPKCAIRGVAATCLGHVARIHRRIDREFVVPALTRLKSDPEVGGCAEDALEDIETFA
jgi:hypothetical protein